MAPCPAGLVTSHPQTRRAGTPRVYAIESRPAAEADGPYGATCVAEGDPAEDVWVSDSGWRSSVTPAGQRRSPRESPREGSADTETPGQNRLTGRTV